MLTVIQYFWQLALLRANPSQVPTATWFVAGVVIANLLLSVVLSSALSPETPVLRISTAIIVQQATLAALLWTALYLRELPQRFMATFAAWLGCDLIITAIFALVLQVVSVLTDAQPGAVFFVFMFWSIAASANILRHAFNTGMPMGVITSLGLTFFATLFSEAAIHA